MSARGITVRAVLSRFYIPSGLLSVAVALTRHAGASASPVASAAKTCTPPKYPGSGYFTSLSVTGTSCSTGIKIAKAYYKCRTARTAVKGRCVKKVDGYSCRETRKSIATEINAKVTCKKGKATVKHSYQQNLDSTLAAPLIFRRRTSRSRYGASVLPYSLVMCVRSL